MYAAAELAPKEGRRQAPTTLAIGGPGQLEGQEWEQVAAGTDGDTGLFAVG
jgi:hypothetical protein